MGIVAETDTVHAMKHLRLCLLVAVALGLVLPTPAQARPCDGIGDTIKRLRAKGLPCDTARTLSAKWAETNASGGGRVVRIDGFRCVRRNPPGPGVAVRCAKRRGAVVVTFRFRRP